MDTGGTMGHSLGARGNNQSHVENAHIGKPNQRRPGLRCEAVQHGRSHPHTEGASAFDYFSKLALSIRLALLRRANEAIARNLNRQNRLPAVLKRTLPSGLRPAPQRPPVFSFVSTRAPLRTRPRTKPLLLKFQLASAKKSE